MPQLVSPLFIFEMANNHMGSVEHGLRIVREFRAICRDLPFHFAFKLQYRDMDTFVHPDYKNRMDLKYVKRFSETRLTEAQYCALKDEIKAQGFLAVCTPYDEPSIDLIEKHGYDILKIASCSFIDWPLLERAVKSKLPVIASPGGIALEDIDKVVSFFEHRGRELALMHCVAEYPTGEQHLQLNQIDLLRNRYPHLRVGYSTHEDPGEVDAVQIAAAKGAVFFEKHVGVPTDTIRLNAYSLTPAQARRWLEAAARAFTLSGTAGRRNDFPPEEIATLKTLRRGVFAKRALRAGERVHAEDVFLAMPSVEKQLAANDLSKYAEILATSEIAPRQPLLTTNTTWRDTRAKIADIVARVKALLRQSGVPVAHKVDLEISHHYGLERFDEYGSTTVTVVNRQYCKRLILMLPGQRHPEQWHEKKDETFHVLYGDIWADVAKVTANYKPGDVVTVERGARHSFGTEKGGIVEEISSAYDTQDSFYSDPAIALNKDRKTYVTHWLERV